MNAEIPETIKAAKYVLSSKEILKIPAQCKSVLPKYLWSLSAYPIF